MEITNVLVYKKLKDVSFARSCKMREFLAQLFFVLISFVVVVALKVYTAVD